jgi:hypothetical protein
MKLGIVAVITALTLPVLAQAQQGGPPSNAPKPTKADAQKVVQIISNDKAKTQAYCEMSKLYQQMQNADQKKVETLGKQADVLAGKLGPEYNKLMDGLEGVNPNSNEGKELDSILSKLDNLCST